MYITKKKSGVSVLRMMFSTARHATSGFPLVPGGQSQRGSWAIGVHVAPCPQAPGHGSIQRLFVQVRVQSQSLELRHS